MIKKAIIIFLLLLCLTAFCGCAEIIEEIFGEKIVGELMSKIDAESAIIEDFSKIAEAAESVVQKFFPEEMVLLKLEEMMDGSEDYSNIYKTNTTYTGEHASEGCKGFAKDVFKDLFGYNIGKTSDSDKYKIEYQSSRTKHVGSVTGISNSSSADEERLKSLFLQGRPGDFVQMQRHHGGSHSAILVSVSSAGVVFFESNVHGTNYIERSSYTWDALCNSNANMSLYSDINYYAE